jgi:hypothetical protein
VKKVHSEFRGMLRDDNIVTKHSDPPTYSKHIGVCHVEAFLNEDGRRRDSSKYDGLNRKGYRRSHSRKLSQHCKLRRFLIEILTDPLSPAGMQGLKDREVETEKPLNQPAGNSIGRTREVNRRV